MWHHRVCIQREALNICATNSEVIGFQACNTTTIRYYQKHNSFVAQWFLCRSRHYRPQWLVIAAHVVRSRLSGSRAGLAPVGMSTHCLLLCWLPRQFTEEETMSYERPLDQLDIQRLPGPLAFADPATKGSGCDLYLMLRKVQCGAAVLFILFSMRLGVLFNIIRYLILVKNFGAHYFSVIIYSYL